MKLRKQTKTHCGIKRLRSEEKENKDTAKKNMNLKTWTRTPENNNKLWEQICEGKLNARKKWIKSDEQKKWTKEIMDENKILKINDNDKKCEKETDTLKENETKKLIYKGEKI